VVANAVELVEAPNPESRYVTELPTRSPHYVGLVGSARRSSNPVHCRKVTCAQLLMPPHHTRTTLLATGRALLLRATASWQGDSQRSNPDVHSD